jgi:hypothetical protein
MAGNTERVEVRPGVLIKMNAEDRKAFEARQAEAQAYADFQAGVETPTRDDTVEPETATVKEPEKATTRARKR